MALDFFAGCVGGAAGVIVGHPLDTVKVRLQTQSPTNIKYRGTFHCLRTIIKNESVSGLYKGISSPLVGVAGVNAIIFGVYGALRPYVSSSPGNDALWAHFAAGSISGAVQSVVASPMELVKTRMQINEDSVGGKKVGAVDVLKGIYRNEGGLFRGVFKGWGITLAREIPGFGFYFASYEAMTKIGDGQVGTLGMMLAGGMAGVISWIVTFPIDVVKTRLQCDDRGKYTGIIDCIRKTYSAEGHQAFSRGLVSTVIRAFPTNAATFTVVTWIMRFAGETPEDDVQNAKQYLDELLTESSKLQERFEDSIRLKVPQYLLHGNSLTSCSLASQCAASAQKYADKTQVYFNFYQTLQQQQQQQAERSQSKVAEKEQEDENDGDNVGVEKKHHVSFLLHEKLAMNIHDDDNDHRHQISGNGEGGAYNISNTREKFSFEEPAAAQQEKVTLISSSRRSQINEVVVSNKNDNEHDEHNRNGESAVRRNNHNIPSTPKSSLSATTTPYSNETFRVERETNAKPVDTTISGDETTAATLIKNVCTNIKLTGDHDKNSSSSTTGLPIQGNARLSHETSSFPAQAIKSGLNTTANERDNDLPEITTGATAVACKSAPQHLNSYEYENDEDNDDDYDAEALSSKDLAYLSKSLDIPAHIISAASLQEKYRKNLRNTSENNNFVREASTQVSSKVALTRPTAANAPAANHSSSSKSNKSGSSSRAQEAWRKYCKTPALKFCKCFEDHCVCYI